MKSERGVSLISLIIYLLTMTIVVAGVARISDYFYNNLNNNDNTLEANEQFVKLNAYITKEINLKGNVVKTIKNDEYIIFQNTGNQYTFTKSTGDIYMNKAKICSNVKKCSFSYSNNIITINLEMNNGTSYQNSYKVL